MPVQTNGAMPSGLPPRDIRPSRRPCRNRRCPACCARAPSGTISISTSIRSSSQRDAPAASSRSSGPSNQFVAVDADERVVADQRAAPAPGRRPSPSAARARRRSSRPSRRRAPQMRLHLIGEIMDVDHDPPDPGVAQLVEHMVDQRRARRPRSVAWAACRQRPHPRPQPRRHHHRRFGTLVIGPTSTSSRRPDRRASRAGCWRRTTRRPAAAPAATDRVPDTPTRAGTAPDSAACRRASTAARRCRRSSRSAARRAHDRRQKSLARPGRRSIARQHRRLDARLDITPRVLQQRHEIVGRVPRQRVLKVEQPQPLLGPDQHQILGMVIAQHRHRLVGQRMTQHLVPRRCIAVSLSTVEPDRRAIPFHQQRRLALQTSHGHRARTAPPGAAPARSAGRPPPHNAARPPPGPRRPPRASAHRRNPPAAPSPASAPRHGRRAPRSRARSATRRPTGRARVLVRRRRVHQDRAPLAIADAEIAAERGVARHRRPPSRPPSHVVRESRRAPAGGVRSAIGPPMPPARP